MTCRRCASTAPPRLYEDPYGDVAETCWSCGHPVEVDLQRVHDLLNRAVMAPAPSKTCHACGKPVLDAAVCSDCWRNVARWLRQIPGLDVELDVTIAKQTRFAEEAQRVTGTATPPLPLHVEAAAAKDHLRATVVPWVKFCEEEEAPRG